MGYRGSVEDESGNFSKYLSQKPLMVADNKSVLISGFYQCPSVEKIYFIKGINFTGPINPEGTGFQPEASKGL
jgi:hypothetical protein